MCVCVCVCVTSYLINFILIHQYIYIYIYIPLGTLAYFCNSCTPRPLSTSVPNPWSVDPK